MFRTLCQWRIFLQAWASGNSKRKLQFPYWIACQTFGKPWQPSTSVLPQSDLWSCERWHPLSTRWHEWPVASIIWDSINSIPKVTLYHVNHLICNLLQVLHSRNPFSYDACWFIFLGLAHGSFQFLNSLFWMIIFFLFSCRFCHSSALDRLHSRSSLLWDVNIFHFSWISDLGLEMFTWELFRLSFPLSIGTFDW